MYIEKDAHKLIIGMPMLVNCTRVINIKDKAINKSVEALDAEIIDIMKNLGVKKI